MRRLIFKRKFIVKMNKYVALNRSHVSCMGQTNPLTLSKPTLKADNRVMTSLFYLLPRNKHTIAMFRPIVKTKKYTNSAVITRYKLFGITLLKKVKGKKKKYYVLGMRLFSWKNKRWNPRLDTGALKHRYTKPLEAPRLLTKTDDILSFPQFRDVAVSIVIPVYNQFDYTKLCLQSILNNTTDIPYEIIIADDCSCDETRNIFEHVDNVKIVRNEENMGFLKNCNQATKRAVGKYILLLNNDTQVQQNWLTYLLETIEKNQEIGLVGSKFIYPDGSLQEVGGIVYSDASGYNYGRNDNPNKLCYNYLKEVDYISGASILLKKTLWDELGGFDDFFSPCYYEDTDLAFRVRYDKGLKVVCDPRSIVVHFEGKSCGTDLAAGMKKYQVVNREKFFTKWKKQLFAYHSRPSDNNFLSRDHALKKKNILVIDYKILTPNEDTGSRTTYQYMLLFRKMGMNVKLFPHDFYIKGNSLQQHQHDGFEVIDEYFPDFIRKNGSQFDYIYLNRPNLAPYYTEFLRFYTKAPIVYQCHDLHYQRQYRERLLANKDEAETMLAKEKQAEFDIFNKMDLVCSFSFDEVEEIQRENPYINARQIPLYILDSEEMKAFSYVASERKDIMFVAGFQHTPNVDAAVWFVKEIFPLILEKNPSIRLYLVGSNPAQKVLDLQAQNIIVTGFVTNEQLDELYSKVRLAVVPLRFGAGVKGKIIESIYHKVPVVTTTIGIEGIDNTSHLISVWDEAGEFASAVNRLYSDTEKLNDLSKESEAFIKHHFSEASAIRALSDYIRP